MESKPASRIPGLDVMKVVALLFVVLYHLTFRNDLYLMEWYLPDLVQYLISCFMSICVPLLFAVSGALALPAPIDLRKNTRKSFQVLFLAIFWCVFSLVWVLLLRGERVSGKEFVSIISDIRYGYIQHLWYMPNFFFLCLVTPVLQHLRNSDRKIYRFGLLVIFIFTFGNKFLNDCDYLVRWVFGLSPRVGNREFLWWCDFFDNNYWYIFIYYALGAFLMEHRDSLKNYRKHALLAIILCVITTFVFSLARTNVYGFSFDPIFNNYDSPFTLVTTAAVFVLLVDVNPGKALSRVAAAISRCSLGIYLIHWLLIEILLVFFPQISGSNRIAPLSTVVILLLSWGITALAMKTPLVKNLFILTPKWVKKA